MTGRMSLPASLVLAFEQLPEEFDYQGDEDEARGECPDCGCIKCKCDYLAERRMERDRYGD